MAQNFLREMMALSLVKKMGSRSIQKLLEVFGAPDKILTASKHELEAVASGRGIASDEIISASVLDRADEEIKKAEAMGVRILTLYDEAYPETLRTIYDPPALLYVQGVFSDWQKPVVAIVGSRAASLYGQKMAREIASNLARAGVVVISGLALGIDSAAHEGALDGGGETLAVLGGGLRKIYPQENKKMSEEILKKGALISEYPVDMAPLPAYFPIRNRIISGLSRGVLVVEAAEKSGALITVDAALEQGRDVFAIPGNADSKRSAGTNRLIKEGAKLVLNANDILEELGLPLGDSQAVHAPGRPVLTPEEEKLLSCFDGEALHVDRIAETSGLSLSATLSTLSYLEMKKLVERIPGEYYRVP